ncbi:hypothetical protein LOC71_08170 [Rhodopirellula sp. JC740]|uniref:Uncharacterized protein n=1 Tax=Rhodopirellula halodulae TaxID=2894198 RepID=A0ABS8NH19_9BACT|nr:hypothetical protein [Rhodopirellula sp. JC740]MCC9642247.1 hypothetical protein [Rhodopirellula sp. JC740]
MFERAFYLIAIAAFLGGHAYADDADTAIKAGDRIQLEFTGNAARKFSRFSLRPAAKAEVPGLSISTIAEVLGLTDDSNVRIEHNTELVVDSKRYRLTLVGTLSPKQILTKITPAGTLVAAAPGAMATETNADQHTRYLRVDDFAIFSDFKLQRWQLIEQLNN